MEQASLAHAVDIFKALAHPARLRILGMLGSGALCVCQITAALGLAVSTVSEHLGELKRAGLVAESKNGRFVSYSLAGGRETEAFLSGVLALIRSDPALRSDQRLTAGLRRVPLESLCRADLDLKRVGLARARPRAAEGSRAWKRA